MNVSRAASTSAAPAPTSPNSPEPGCNLRRMGEEDRPSGLGWPTVEPRSADAPQPTSEHSRAGDRAANGRPFWSLSSGDHHALWLNFLGSIVSGVVLAVVLGGSIALARFAQGIGVGNLALITLGIGFLCFVVIISEWQRRRRREPAVAVERSGVPEWSLWFGSPWMGPFWILFMVLIVTWIGFAAGIGK
jgi:hypothetical protein